MSDIDNKELKESINNALESTTQYWEQTLDEKLDQILEQKLDKYFEPVVKLLSLLVQRKD